MRALLLLLATACGRIGFQAVSEKAAADADADAPTGVVDAADGATACGVDDLGCACTAFSTTIVVPNTPGAAFAWTGHDYLIVSSQGMSHSLVTVHGDGTQGPTVPITAAGVGAVTIAWDGSQLGLGYIAGAQYHVALYDPVAGAIVHDQPVIAANGIPQLVWAGDRFAILWYDSQAHVTEVDPAGALLTADIPIAVGAFTSISSFVATPTGYAFSVSRAAMTPSLVLANRPTFAPITVVPDLPSSNGLLETAPGPNGVGVAWADCAGSRMQIIGTDGTPVAAATPLALPGGTLGCTLAGGGARYQFVATGSMNPITLDAFELDGNQHVVSGPTALGSFAVVGSMWNRSNLLVTPRRIGFLDGFGPATTDHLLVGQRCL